MFGQERWKIHTLIQWFHHLQSADVNAYFFWEESDSVIEQYFIIFELNVGSNDKNALKKSDLKETVVNINLSFSAEMCMSSRIFLYLWIWEIWRMAKKKWQRYKYYRFAYFGWMIALISIYNFRKDFLHFPMFPSKLTCLFRSIFLFPIPISIWTVFEILYVENHFPIPYFHIVSSMFFLLQ